MSTGFGQLISKIDQGECLSGSFVRRAVDVGAALVFEQLIVSTYGGCQYATVDPKENEEFFRRVDYNGCGISSGYSAHEHCSRYETVGNWQSAHK